MRFASVVRLVVLGLMTVRGVAQAPAYESDPKYMAAIKDANEALRSRQYNFVVEDYKKANKVAGGQCVMCLTQAYDWQMKMGNYKDAVALAEQRVALMKTPVQKSVAKNDQASAMLRMAGDKPKPEKLEAVHAVYRAALTDYPKNLSARFSDACVLAKMGKMDDAGKEFSACAEAASPTDPSRMRAMHFAENPALSLHTMAPAFTVTALDGSKFTLDEMNGKVVLIDFWATWCGPCNEELPHMRKIAKEFAGQPLVIISVSWDADETKWKDFLVKNEMTWVQYRDADHSVEQKVRGGGDSALLHDRFRWGADGGDAGVGIGCGREVEEADCAG